MVTVPPSALRFNNLEDMMSIFNDNFLSVIEKHLAEIKASGKNEFLTVDVIRQYLGHYISDTTNANESLNANIGKFLGEKEKELGIIETAKSQAVTDDRGNPSKSSLWRFR
jgi:hypothetical protein